MLSVAQIVSIVSNCKFEPWQIKVHTMEDRLYLQIHCENGKDNVIGEPLSWSGRKWLLSFHMTETQVVKTALKACLAATEHEALENFKYHDLTVFDPRISIDSLIRIREDHPLDGRK